MRNPYIVGPFVFGPNFYGRQTLIDGILDERHQCIYLIGNRRSGKTSLLRHLESLDDQTHTAIIYLDLQAIGGSSVKLGKYIVDQVKRKVSQSPFLEQVSFGKSKNVCDVLTDLAETAVSKKFSVLMLWDEAEELLDLTPKCLKRLRAALQQTPALRTVLATTKRLSLLNEKCREWLTSPFLSGFQTQYVSPLTESEAIQLIRQTNNLEGPVQVDDQLLNQIILNTGNSPYLLQLLCDRLFQTNGQLYSISEDDLIVDEQLADFFQIDFAALSPSEQAILRMLAGRSSANEDEMERELVLSADQLRSYLSGLGQLGFLKHMAQGEYQIANRFLLTWLRNVRIDDRPLTNTSRKGAITETNVEHFDDSYSTSPPIKMNSPIILLVTVTKTETQAVMEVFSSATGQPWQRQHIDDKTYYALGSLGGAEIFMVQSEMGTATPGGALLTVHKAIEALKPVAVIMVGIAFGLKPKEEKHPQDQELGHILVARQIMTYEPQKLKGAQITPRGDRVTCSTSLLSKFRDGDLDWTGAKVWFGLVLSGEKLVADEGFRAELLALEPEAIGGEMEGAGLYAAASDAKADWILVKGICDWADGRKNDTAQPLAAQNASGFVRHVIQLGGWTETERRAQMPGSKTAGKTIMQQASDHATQIGQARDVNIHTGPVFNIQGGVHAGRDVIQGEQTNITYAMPPVETPSQFSAALSGVQAQLVVLLNQADLTTAQRRNLQAAQEQVTQSAAAAHQPQPDGGQVKRSLAEARETIELVSGSLKSAVGLGTLLAGLIEAAVRLFGG